MFPLGGISGAPFSGKTGFEAFSTHVPHNGNVLVLFGPHVAISEAGEVGKYLRAGQHRHSTACGAVIGAFNSCDGHNEGADDLDETDMQMEFIRKYLAPYRAQIQADENPMASLAHQAFNMVATEIEKVVNNDFGTGALVLLGGITINMPPPYEEHFFPCTFQIRRKGEDATPINLMQSFYCPLTQ